MITDFIREYNMLPEGSRVLCAVSGGADSGCMLHMLKSRERELGIRVFCAHYEHGLRGEESLRDMAFVEQCCQNWGIDFVAERGDVLSYAAQNGMSTEEAARELRYAFLQRAAQQFACDRIATAHNADDNAETVIFNLTRGGAAKGLSGIPPVRGNIIRPMLCLERAEIEDYIRRKGLSFVEDSSNSQDVYSRNIIRHRVMPVLKEINPGLCRAVSRSSELLRQDEEFLDLMAKEFIDCNYDGESLDVKALLELHRALASRVIRKLWSKSLGFEHVEAILDFASGSGLGSLNVPGGSICRQQGRLYFSKPSEKCIEQRRLIPGETLEIPEAGIRLVSSLTDYPQEIHNKFKTLLLKYESICGNILCTCRRPGDNIHPAGRGCGKSLKKLFAELKLTQQQRNLTPVLRDDKGLIAVVGIAVDRRSEAKPGDKVLRIDIEDI